MSQQEGKTVPVITEEDLVKSLAELEGKAAPAPAPAQPQVQVVALEKTAAQTVQELGSETLQKALDVSPILDEVVTLMGIHVDRSQEQMAKSINAAAERDSAIIRVLGELKKSIDANTEAVKAAMDAPGAPAATRPVTSATGEVLAKSVGAGSEGKKEVKPEQLRKSIIDGLSSLVKSNGINSSDGQRMSKALIKFESTGEISDADMAAALKAG